MLKRLRRKIIEISVEAPQALRVPKFKTSVQEFCLRSIRNSKSSRPISCEKISFFHQNVSNRADCLKKNESFLMSFRKIFEQSLVWKKNGKASSLYVLFLQNVQFFCSQTLLLTRTMTLRSIQFEKNNGGKKKKKRAFDFLCCLYATFFNLSSASFFNKNRFFQKFICFEPFQKKIGNLRLNSVEGEGILSSIENQQIVYVQPFSLQPALQKKAILTEAKQPKQF